MEVVPSARLPQGPTAAPILFARTDFQWMRSNLGGAGAESVMGPGTLLDDFQGMTDTGWIPPDTMGAVGPSHVANMLNGGWEVFTRAGASLGAVTLQDFWSPLGTGAGQPASFVFDPSLLYDQYSGRWVAVSDGNPQQVDGTNNSWVLVGISDTDDPTGGWNLFGVKANIAVTHPSHFADFPRLGVDPNNVVVTNNMFTLAGAYVHSDLWVFDKASLIAGGALVAGTDYSLHHNPCATGGFSFTPCHTFGQNAGNAVNYLLDQGWLDAATRTRRFFRVKPISGTGAAATLVCNNDFIEVNGYNFNKLDAPQPNCGTAINTNDSRLLNAVWRNGKVWTTHSVGAGSGITDAAPPSKAEIAWYEMDPTDGAAFPGGLPLQQGRVVDAGLAFSFPSIAVNNTECVALGFSGAGAAAFASAFYTLRTSSDPPGFMNPPALLKAGEGHYFKTQGTGRNRWGDYSATVIDPLDDETFWTTQEYARVPVGNPLACGVDTGRWGLWWGRIECNNVIPDPQPEPGGVHLNRFVGFVIPPLSGNTAIRVHLTTLNHPRFCCDPLSCAAGLCTICNATTCDVDAHCNSAPFLTCGHQSAPGTPNYSTFETKVRYANSFPGGSLVCPDDAAPFNTNYRCATLGCDPEYRDWSTDLMIGVNPAAPRGLLFLTGDAVVPSSMLDVAQIDTSCGGTPGANTCPMPMASGALAIGTAKWGDITSAGFGPPDGTSDVLDLPPAINKLKGVPTLLPEYRVWLKQRGPRPDLDAITVVDVSDAVSAGPFAQPYPSVRTIDACPHD
jgi:hypothetical protein